MVRKSARTARIIKDSAGAYKVAAGRKEKAVIVPRKDGGKPTYVPPDGASVTWLFGGETAWRII